MTVSKVIDTESWSYTQMREVNLTHTWTIDHFSQRQESVGEAIKSSIFSAVADGKKCNWCLRLYPMGDAADAKDNLSLFLCLVSSHKEQIRAIYKLSILANGNKHNTNEGSEEFKVGDSWGSSQFIRRDIALRESSSYLQNDKLTIFCQVTLLEDSVTISGQVNTLQLEPDHRLSYNLGQLFDNKKFSDVTLSVSGLEIQAHKNILAVRSPVFAAMFEDGWKEGEQKKIEIMKVEYMVLREMLRFIYTGKVMNLENKAEELLEVAERHLLEGLKEICEEALCVKLSVENAADYLILADLYRADRLKDRSIAFVNKHAGDVKKTPGWKSLYTSHPHLLADAWMNLMSIH